MRKLVGLVLVLCFSLVGCGSSITDGELDSTHSGNISSDGIVHIDAYDVISLEDSDDLAVSDLSLEVEEVDVSEEVESNSLISSDNLSYVVYTQDEPCEYSSNLLSVVVVTNNNTVSAEIRGTFTMSDTNGEVFDTIKDSILVDSGKTGVFSLANDKCINLGSIDISLVAFEPRYSEGSGDLTVSANFVNEKLIGTVTNDNDYVVSFPCLTVLFFDEETFIDYSRAFVMDSNNEIAPGEVQTFSFINFSDNPVSYKFYVSGQHC